MLSTLFKKKLSDEQLANVFINGILEVVDNGFDEIKSMIEEDPSFARNPNMEGATDDFFAMIVITANIKSLGLSFSSHQLNNIEPIIFKHFAEIFQMEESKFVSYFNEYSAFMKRVNHPSKVILYSMSKAFFYKYKLNEFQEDYFRTMDTPNPLFIKRLDGIMENFIWNWDAFFKRYKMQS